MTWQWTWCTGEWRSGRRTTRSVGDGDRRGLRGGAGGVSAGGALVLCVLEWQLRRCGGVGAQSAPGVPSESGWALSGHGYAGWGGGAATLPSPTPAAGGSAVGLTFWELCMLARLGTTLPLGRWGHAPGAVLAFGRLGGGVSGSSRLRLLRLVGRPWARGDMAARLARLGATLPLGRWGHAPGAVLVFGGLDGGVSGGSRPWSGSVGQGGVARRGGALYARLSRWGDGAVSLVSSLHSEGLVGV
jgi:hypothetical protein